MVGSVLKYRAYGMEIASDFRLDLHDSDSDSAPSLSILSSFSDYFESLELPESLETDDDGYSFFASLPDRSVYLLYEDQFQLHVEADGSRILVGDIGGDEDNLQGFILTHALSIALALRGMESLHATAVTFRNGRAVALMAPSGSGKSTLAANCLANGAKLLTDDLLVLRQCHSGFHALPGPRRLKLYPAVARTLLSGTSVQLPEAANGGKWLLPLPDAMVETGEAPLSAIAVLTSDPEETQIVCDPLGARDAFFELVAGRYPSGAQGKAQLEQHFQFTRAVQRGVRIIRLRYPRDIGRIDEVRRAIEREAGAA